MLDQDTVTARVVALLSAEGRSLRDLSAPELDAYVAAAFADLLAETPVCPTETACS